MNIVEFAKLVKRMRTAQKKYFSTRDKDILQESKTLEKLVDQQTEQLLGNTENQQRLL